MRAMFRENASMSTDRGAEPAAAPEAGGGGGRGAGGRCARPGLRRLGARLDGPTGPVAVARTLGCALPPLFRLRGARLLRRQPGRQPFHRIKPSPGLDIFSRYPSSPGRVGELSLCLNMVSKSRSVRRRTTEFVAAGAKARFAPLLALALAASLGACASTVADLPPQMGGLPAGTPE